MPAALAKNGVQVLKDARTHLTINGEGVELAGIRFWTRRPADIAPSCAAPPAPVVLLAHDPRRLTEAAALKIPLVLSGHTHGGQVVLPGLGAIAAQKFPVVAGIGRRRTNRDVRQPRRRDGLRAGPNQLPAGSRRADAAT